MKDDKTPKYKKFIRKNANRLMWIGVGVAATSAYYFATKK